MTKEEKALTAAVRRHLTTMAKEIREHIIKGLDPSHVASGTTWSLSEKSYVHVVFTGNMLFLEVVLGDYMLAEVRRRAIKPGIRQADLIALKKFVKEGPKMLVDGFTKSIEALLNCGNTCGAIVNMARSEKKRVGKINRHT